MNCRTLQYKYNSRNCIATFEDGTTYTLRELLFLAHQDLSLEDEYKLHLVKKIFGGDIELPPLRRPIPKKKDYLSDMARKLPPAKLVKVKKEIEPVQLELDL